MDNSAINCGKVIDAETKSNDDETKTVPTNLSEKI